MFAANIIMTSLKMDRRRPERSPVVRWMTWLGLGMIGVGLTAVAHAGVQHRVSQKGRAFTPALLEVQHGDSIEFMNDDGELLHHAYLDNDRFSFDTGDQGPGSKTIVAFPTTGTFTVMCGIHPKMKLTVQVR